MKELLELVRLLRSVAGKLNKNYDLNYQLIDRKTDVYMLHQKIFCSNFCSILQGKVLKTTTTKKAGKCSILNILWLKIVVKFCFCQQLNWKKTAHGGLSFSMCKRLKSFQIFQYKRHASNRKKKQISKISFSKYP